MRRYLKSPLRLILAGLLGAGGAAVLGLAGAYQYLRPSLPDVTAIKDIRLQVPLRVFSRDGQLIDRLQEGTTTLQLRGVLGHGLVPGGEASTRVRVGFDVLVADHHLPVAQ